VDTVSGSVDRNTVERILGADLWSRPAGKVGIYLAAPYSEKARVRDLATVLRAMDIPIASTWHNIEDPPHVDDAELCRRAEQNHGELRRAAAAVFLLHRGTPRETLVEMGAALEQGKECLAFVDPAQHWTQIPISVRRERVTREDVPLESTIHTGELAWLAMRITVWFSGLP
jgi:nucleoside 2-deoxyribosyltransferase